MKKKLIELPIDLLKEIEAEAKKTNRSANKQIVFLLKSALDKKE